LCRFIPSHTEIYVKMRMVDSYPYGRLTKFK
jgi:hypothetical protein